MTAPAIPAGALHPAFAPYAQWLEADRPAAIPAPAALERFARAADLALPDGTSLHFVAAAARREPALDYECRIAHSGGIAFRAGSLHDFCNALAWLAFPRTKAALNAVHVAARPAPAGAGRSRARDAATLVDESGMIVACADDTLLRDWDARAWRAAFGSRGEGGATRLRALAIGHGLLAKCVAPFRALTAHALVVPLDAARLPAAPGALAAILDAAAATQIAAAGGAWSPAQLRPLPIAALPGWDRERLGARLFDDPSVFRPRSRPPSPRSVRPPGAAMLR